jgi:DNA-binding transcriptional MerR regulator
VLDRRGGGLYTREDHTDVVRGQIARSPLGPVELAGATTTMQPNHEQLTLAIDAGYSGTAAASIVGITYRQLDYWARTDLVRPSLVDAAGSGSRRRYSYRELLELRVVKSLLDAGIKLDKVRVAFDYLRTHVTTDIGAAHLVISGNDVVLCDGDQLIDVVRRTGQGVLNVLPIGGVKDELDAKLVAHQPSFDESTPDPATAARAAI